MLLHRTRLAYVHLPNLLTDAKRDRTARVYGYVQLWLAEELLLLFLQEGEVVNATMSADGRRFRTLPIAEALASVPGAAEFGEVCFQQCEDEQLAAMYISQTSEPLAWPPELNAGDAVAVLGFLHSTMHDGVVEVRSDSGVHYGMSRNGRVVRGYFADEPIQPQGIAQGVAQGVAHGGEPGARLAEVIAAARSAREPVEVRLWPVPPPLMVQAPPALIAAYRDLMRATIARLVEHGATGAAAVAEHARLQLAARHPSLNAFAGPSPGRDPIVSTEALTAAAGAWLVELLWAAAPGDGTNPGRLLGDAMRDRRHLFQSAGLSEALPWKLEW